MRIFGLKNCDTCKSAQKTLAAAGHDTTLIDVRATPLSEADLGRFLTTFGAALVNRRSTTWRNLPEAERAEDPQALLARYPALMKRPVIDTGDRLHLGWGADTKAALLG